MTNVVAFVELVVSLPVNPAVVFKTTAVLDVELVGVCDITDGVKVLPSVLVAFVALIGVVDAGEDPVIVEFVKVIKPAGRDVTVLMGIDMLSVVV